MSNTMDSQKLLAEDYPAPSSEQYKTLGDHLADLQQQVDAFDPVEELVTIKRKAWKICSLTQLVHLETGINFPKKKTVRSAIVKTMQTFVDRMGEVLGRKRMSDDTRANLTQYRDNVQGRQNSIRERTELLEALQFQMADSQVKGPSYKKAK